jgi:hypothetical protein
MAYDDAISHGQNDLSRATQLPAARDSARVPFRRACGPIWFCGKLASEEKGAKPGGSPGPEGATAAGLATG